MIKVLFVCMGNICRSPIAEGVFQHLIEDQGLSDKVDTDSAGTIGYHVGKPPDARGIKAARAHDIDISMLRARQVEPTDLDTFDYIVAMDHHNRDYLLELAGVDQRRKIHMFLDFAPHLPLSELPDPYYGHAEDFEDVVRVAFDAGEGLLAHIKEKGCIN